MTLCLTEVLKESGATPIIKWAGGKRQLLPEIQARVPKSFHTYHEPFLGGAAVFFALEPHKAVLSDINEELINLYRVLQQHPHELFEHLQTHRVSQDYFMALRQLDRTSAYQQLSSLERASRFIYLNKTCFNGLYRVNSRGHFNVPYGHYKNPQLATLENLLACSRLLQGVELVHASFHKSLTRPQAKDFVYLDPPYIPLSATASFTSYAKEGFSLNDQQALALLCQDLDAKGVYFLLSNSDTPLTHELFKNFQMDVVQAKRAISASGANRQKVTEVLVRNYN